ncbi:hypothetical protein SAMN05421771_3808 [Granulicella pectinivorans]|uniref:Uncharacterized protein n=2 Tax=Granulicella pectinivorans TaxID=474950 RepID=A0A1I6MYT7_9BACT|nr:hypothetical protein SAMN05421771_3808 [Granulicella pectinivorans]
MRERIHPDAVANAFLSSLSSRRMDLRSALGSYSAILRLEPHPYTQARGRIDCAICGDYLESRQTDINILNFERLKWGGVRHTQPLYAGLDLEWFSSLQVPEATQEDRSHLRQLLDRVSTLSPHGRPNDLEKAIKGIFASNQSERRTVIDILGLSGVLVPMGLPNFFSTYPKSAERKQPDKKNDWNYPVLWWRGSDGINEEALRFWFPNL